MFSLQTDWTSGLLLRLLHRMSRGLWRGWDVLSMILVNNLCSTTFSRGISWKPTTGQPKNPNWWFYLWLIKDKIYFHFKIIFYITTTLHQYVALWNFSIPTSEIHNSTCTLVFPDSKILTLLFFVCSLDLLVILFYGKHHILVRCCVSTHAHHAPLIKPCFLTSAASSLPVPRWRGSVKFQVSFRQ